MKTEYVIYRIGPTPVAPNVMSGNSHLEEMSRHGSMQDALTEVQRLVSPPVTDGEYTILQIHSAA